MNASTPEKEFIVGSVRAAVWANPRHASGKLFVAYKVVVEKIDKDLHGNFKSSDSFDAHDIPKAILVLKKAYDYLTLKNPAGGSSNAERFQPVVRLP